MRETSTTPENDSRRAATLFHRDIRQRHEGDESGYAGRFLGRYFCTAECLGERLEKVIGRVALDDIGDATLWVRVHFLCLPPSVRRRRSSGG